MKTSNKLLILVTLVIIAFMVIHDVGLKAEFLKAEFKSRFYQMEQLSFKNFSAVKHVSGDKVGVQIVKGDKFQVWIKSYLKDKISITQQGKTLIISTKLTGTRLWGYGDGVVIICPQLDSFTAVSDAETNNRKGDYNQVQYSGNSIASFNQQNMVINLSKGTGVELVGNQIDDLQATVGDKLIGKAYLNINSNNLIKQANIQVPGKSELDLKNPTIGKLNYTIADSAKVIVNGGSIGLLK